MNIKDFLIENYIWIIVIILITIVTVIGFLADKNKEKKKAKGAKSTIANEKTTPQPLSTMNNQPTNIDYQAPLQYQQPQETPSNLQMNNNMGMDFNVMNTTVKPLNRMDFSTNETQPIITQPQPLQPIDNQVGLMNNPQPVENVAPNIQQESMYQPLSEQKPIIAPQPVPNFSAMQSPVNNGFNQVQPMPVNNIQPESNPYNVIPPVSQPINGQPEMIMPEQVLNQTQIYNNMQPQIQSNDNNFTGMPTNNTTIPQPVNPIPAPKSVMPEPMIIQGNYNQTEAMQQNLGQSQLMGQSGNTNINQPVQNVIPQPINFVYGPQNNNQNM